MVFYLHLFIFVQNAILSILMKGRIIMLQSFKGDCRNLIKDIEKDYLLNNSEILLWIYINIYFYRGIKDTQLFYEKKVFLKYLKESMDFCTYYERYESLDEGKYQHLYHEILEKYFSNKKMAINIDDMEAIYEGLIIEEERVKTGSYYTPRWIAEYMTFKSITTYIDGKIDDGNNILENYLLNKNHTIQRDYILKVIEILEEFKIADIACGGGIFLRQCLIAIYNITIKLYKLIGRGYNSTKIIERTLQNNLYGVDLQYDTTILCKVLILLEAQNLGYNHTKKWSLRIFHGDSLRMDFMNQGISVSIFDIIIGNPPYIGEKGNKAIFDTIRESEFGIKYYERNMDYFYFFFYKSYELLREKGVLCYITTNYFVTADGAKKMRGFLKDNYSFREIINFNTLKIFADAQGQHNMISLLVKSITALSTKLINFVDKSIDINTLYEKLLLKENFDSGIEFIQIPQEALYDKKGQISIQGRGQEREVLDKIGQIANFTIGDLCFVNQGIVSGADKLSSSWGQKLNMNELIGKGIFVLTEEELEALNLDDVLEKKYVKCFYKNSHIKKYYTLRNQGLYILYINDNNLSKIEEHPNIYKHLIKFKEILEQRREVKKGVRKWYALQWPRDSRIFEEEKIIVPQRSFENTFAYTREDFYASADVYYITAKKPQASLLYLLAVLNSSLGYFWLYYRGKRKGEHLELYATPLKSFPISYPDDYKKIYEIESLVNEMMDCLHNEKAIRDIQDQIDENIFEIYQLDSSDKDIIMDFVEGKS